jgi:hypothetical protein
MKHFIPRECANYGTYDHIIGKYLLELSCIIKGISIVVEIIHKYVAFTAKLGANNYGIGVYTAACL